MISISTQSNLSLYEYLGVLTYKLGLSETQFTKLAEWLEVFVFIWAKDQDLNESANYLNSPTPSSSHYYSLWEFTLILEKHYTTTQQSNIIRYIQCIPRPQPTLQIHNQRIQLT